MPALVFRAGIAVTGLSLATAGPPGIATAVKWGAVVAVDNRYGTALIAP